MSRPRLLREGLVFLLVLGAAVAASVAWQWWARNRTVAPLTPLGEQCAEEIPRGADRVTFRGADGTTIGAASVGPDDARTAVVLRQGASQTLCDWLPWAATVAEETGARVLLFDRRGRGSTPADEGLILEPEDLARAASLVSEDGAERVVLVASSMGNSVQLAALPLLEQAPCGLVAISPVLSSGDDSGRLSPDPAAVRSTAWPDRVWVTWEEQNPGVAAQAARLVAAAEAQGRTVETLPVDTEDHSRQLVARHPQVASWVSAAVAACA